MTAVQRSAPMTDLPTEAEWGVEATCQVPWRIWATLVVKGCRLVRRPKNFQFGEVFRYSYSDPPRSRFYQHMIALFLDGYRNLGGLAV